MDCRFPLHHFFEFNPMDRPTDWIPPTRNSMRSVALIPLFAAALNYDCTV
jgi:hypothetical protein